MICWLLCVVCPRWAAIGASHHTPHPHVSTSVSLQACEHEVLSMHPSLPSPQMPLLVSLSHRVWPTQRVSLSLCNQTLQACENEVPSLHPCWAEFAFSNNSRYPQVREPDSEAPGLSDATPGLSDAAPGLFETAPGLFETSPGLLAIRVDVEPGE
jgi:hypothetical protein